jgi:hypothetical protein
LDREVLTDVLAKCDFGATVRYSIVFK